MRSAPGREHENIKSPFPHATTAHRPGKEMRREAVTTRAVEPVWQDNDDNRLDSAETKRLTPPSTAATIATTCEPGVTSTARRAGRAPCLDRGDNRCEPEGPKERLPQGVPHQRTSFARMRARRPRRNRAWPRRTPPKGRRPRRRLAIAPRVPVVHRRQGYKSDTRTNEPTHAPSRR